MSSDIFFPLGIALVVAALVLAFVGLRTKSFPASKGAFAATVGLMVLLVAGTLTAAVVLAEDEQTERNQEIAQQAEEAAPLPAESEQTTEATTEATTTAAENPVLALTSPADGGLEFDPATLTAATGTVVIDYTNPSPVPHNLALEDAEGNILGDTETVTGGQIAELSSDLEPGSYAFYCAVPGHREAGMEGELTVD